MNITLFDPNVSSTMNGFLILANIINLIYNIPQIVKTIKTKSTKDFSEWFLALRICGNIIWIGYALSIDSFMLLLNSIVTVVSTIIISIYKIKEIKSNKSNDEFKEMWKRIKSNRQLNVNAKNDKYYHLDEIN
jgi:uncharacterized protein with PQ loop repeat